MSITLLPRCMARDETALPLGSRERILTAAAELVARGGVEALTTRAVATAAQSQAPTIYRLFGDKQGLLDAVAEHALAEYATRTGRRQALDDPVEELRAAWDEHIAFGLSHPAVYRLMSGAGRRGQPSPAAQEGMAALRARVHRAARAGLLRVSEERGVALIHAAGTGTVTALLEMPDDKRDDGLSLLAREAVLSAILAAPPTAAASETAQLAGALRTRIHDAEQLTAGERLLMDELLARLSEVR